MMDVICRQCTLSQKQTFNDKEGVWMPQLDPHPRAALSWENSLSLLKQWVCLGFHDAQDSNSTQDYRFYSREGETVAPLFSSNSYYLWDWGSYLYLHALLSRDNVCTIAQLFEMNKWMKCSKMSNHHHWFIWEAPGILYHVNLLKLYITL